jgi:hypothetical protein
MCLGSAGLKTHSLFGFRIDRSNCHLVSPARDWIDDYELNVPLAALSACVEDRHIANCGQQRPFVQSERLIQRICCSGYAVLRRHDLHDPGLVLQKSVLLYPRTYYRDMGFHDRVRTVQCETPYHVLSTFLVSFSSGHAGRRFIWFLRLPVDGSSCWCRINFRYEVA